MDSGKKSGLAEYRSDLIQLSGVGTDALVQDHISYALLGDVVEYGIDVLVAFRINFCEVLLGLLLHLVHVLKSLKLVEVVDGKEVVKVLGEDIDINDVNFNGATPAKIYDSKSKTFKYEVPIYIGETALVTKDGKPVCATVYIGVKGDANLDNRVTAVDATYVFKYVKALNEPAMQTDPDAPYKIRLNTRVDEGTDSDLEELSAFLADVDQNEYDENNWNTKKKRRRFNVSDASMILNWIQLYNTEKAQHDDVEPTDSTRYDLWVKATAGKNIKGRK